MTSVIRACAFARWAHMGLTVAKISTSQWARWRQAVMEDTLGLSGQLVVHVWFTSGSRLIHLEATSGYRLVCECFNDWCSRSRFLVRSWCASGFDWFIYRGWSVWFFCGWFMVESWLVIGRSFFVW